MKKICSMVLTLSVLCSIIGMLISCDTSKIRFEKTTYLYFDTEIRLVGYAKNEAEFEKAWQLFTDEIEYFHRLTDAFSFYSGIVNVHSINENPVNEWMTIPKDLYELLSLGCQLSIESKDVLDIAMGKITFLWKNAQETKSLPTETQIQDSLDHIGINKILLAPEEYQIKKMDEQVKIDLGAIAKGYAVEKAKEKLCQEGFSGYLIDAGGNLFAIGEKPKEPFKVAIKQDSDPNKNIKTMYLQDQALVTSGSTNRYFMIDNQKYHHLISKKTGYPENLYTSVSVLCDNSFYADYLSTTLFFLSIEKGKDLLSKYHAIAYYQCKDGHIEESHP